MADILPEPIANWHIERGVYGKDTEITTHIHLLLFFSFPFFPPSDLDLTLVTAFLAEGGRGARRRAYTEMEELWHGMSRPRDFPFLSFLSVLWLYIFCAVCHEADILLCFFVSHRIPPT